MTFSYVNSRESQTSCIDCCHLKKRYFETNDRRMDGKDSKDKKDDFDEDSHFDESVISPWTVCQFEFDEDYLSNGNEDRKSIRN